jgi:hypothetical protein
MLEKLKNLLSRKFLLTVASNLIVILVALGVDGDTAKIVLGACTIVINAIYIIVEGSIDKKNLASLLDNISDIISEVQVEDESTNNEGVNNYDGAGESPKNS